MDTITVRSSINLLAAILTNFSLFSTVMPARFLVPLAAQVSAAGTNNPVVEKSNYIIRFGPNTGSYSLYKREVGKNRLVRLINDREPRSTYIAIALNRRVYTLGRSTRYLAPKSERLTLLTDGGAISWQLPQRINVKYYIRVLNESSLTSYIRLNIIVKNSSSITQSVGMFHMFDIANNNLGLPAFSLPDGDVFREIILESRQVPYFIQTSYNAYFYLDVRGSSRPDRVILANWTKLHEAGWNYGFQLNSQGFGYNLYDSNNPAIGVYYDARPLSARQSRSYVLYLAFDAIPSFSKLREFAPVQDQANPVDTVLPDNIPQTAPNNSPLTEELLRQLIEEQRRSNELLEQRKETMAATNEEQPPSNDLNISDTAPTLIISKIDIQSLNLLYHSENKRFAQLQAQQENLEIVQKLQQIKLQQISSYRMLSSPEENLQAWLVQQTRLLGQLDNWNTYLVNIVAQLPESLHEQPEVIKFHNNLRDFRLALKELSEQWSLLIERVGATWDDWQEGEIGEPPKRISNSLYQNQQKLISYMNEISDLARYSNGVQQYLQIPLSRLYGEMSQTLLVVRQRLTDISLIQQELYQEFSSYAEQAKQQTGTKARLQRNLFRNEQQLQSSSHEFTAIEAQLQVAFSNIRLLEQWQEDIEFNQSRLAYDPYQKESELKELLQQIGSKIDDRNLTLQKLQSTQNEIQSELDQQQIIKVVAMGLPELLQLHGKRLLGENRAWNKDWHTVQLINPYSYDSGESTPRNKMSDTVRQQIDEYKLYNAIKGFPGDTEPPLPDRRRPNAASNSSSLTPHPSSANNLSPQQGGNGPIVPAGNAVISHPGISLPPSLGEQGSQIVPPNSENGILNSRNSSEVSRPTDHSTRSTNIASRYPQNQLNQPKGTIAVRPPDDAEVQLQETIDPNYQGRLFQIDSAAMPHNPQTVDEFSPPNDTVQSRDADSSEQLRGNLDASSLQIRASVPSLSESSHSAVLPDGDPSNKDSLYQPATGDLLTNQSATLLPSNVIGQQDNEALQPGAVTDSEVMLRSATLNPKGSSPKSPNQTIQLQQQHNTEEPYRDVKNFIRDVDNYLAKRKFSNETVNDSEKRWSYLEKKYNVQK